MLGKIGTISNLDIDSNETIAEIDVSGFPVLWIRFTVAVASLTAFSVAFRLTGTDPYFTIASASGDFTTPEGPILGASGDLTGAAAGSHWLKLDVAGIQTVRLQGAGSSSTVVGVYRKG